MTTALILSLLAAGALTARRAREALSTEPSWAEGEDRFWSREYVWMTNNGIIPGMDICEHEKLAEGHDE